jgi:hemolysin activation/secretion protein
MFKVFCKLVLFYLTFNLTANKVAIAEKVKDTSEYLITVKSLNFEGNTVFDDAQLKKIITPFKTKKLTLERLLQVRAEITDYYVKQGYISSGAFIAPQNLADGNINIQIIEGTLQAIEIVNKPFLKKKYIISRLPSTKQIFNINSLTASIKKLQNNPLIDKIKVEIIQLDTGQAKLLLKVTENPRFNKTFIFTNSYAPSIGQYGGQANFQFHVLGYGDLLNFSLTKTEGLDKFSGTYSLPINQYDTQLKLEFITADSRLIEESVSDVDIRGEFNSYQIGVMYPIKFNSSEQLNLSIEFNLIRGESFVLEDLSFSFVESLNDGKSQFPTKQFALGGVNSVRGYQPNLLVGDNGLVLSSELKFSALQFEESELRVISFVEGGAIWNNNQELDETTLLSIGLGLEYSILNYLDIKLEQGIPLINPDNVQQNAVRTTFFLQFSP